MLSKHIQITSGNSVQRLECKACTAVETVASTMSCSEYQGVVDAFSEKHNDCTETDHARIKLSTDPNIWIGGKDGVFNLDTAIHFVLFESRTKVWCSHGSWEAKLVYDDNGKLINLMITSYYEYYDEASKSHKPAPLSYPGRLRSVDGYQLTPNRVERIGGNYRVVRDVHKERL